MRAEEATLGDRPAVSIWVEDQGPGVPDDVAHRLFEPFAKPFGIGHAQAQRRREPPGLVSPLLVLRAKRIIAQLRYVNKCPLSVWQLHLRGMLKRHLGRGNWIPLNGCRRSAFKRRA